MDPTKGSSNGAYGPNPPQYNPDVPQYNSEPPPYNPNFPQYNPNLPHYNPNPPPYNPHDFNGNGSNAAVSYEVNQSQDGKVHIPVVSPDDRPQEIAAVDPENSFSDAAIRRGFIRKVYLILMIQLLVTFGIICAFLYWEDLRIWTFDNSWFSFTMIGVVMVLVLVLSCCGNIRRRVPFNFIALGLFTVAEGLMLGSLAAYYEAEAVLWAVGATALVSLSLTLFALQSKWDFTRARGSLWVFGWTLFSFALLCAILRSQYLYILYACLGTLLFSLYLVFDTQLILGGKHKKYQMSPEEYVFAALSLYLDIVTLFLLLLQLIGLCRA